MNIEPTNLILSQIILLYIPIIICVLIGYPLGGAMKGKSQFPPKKWLLFAGFGLLASLTFSVGRPNTGGDGVAGLSNVSAYGTDLGLG